MQKHSIIVMSYAAATSARHSHSGEIMAWPLPFERAILAPFGADQRQGTGPDNAVTAPW